MRILIVVIAMAFCFEGMAKPTKKTAVICGRLPQGMEEMVTLKVIAEKLTSLEMFETKSYNIQTAGGKFYCEVDVPVDLSYITISFKKKELQQYKMIDYLIGYGDSVYIEFENGSVNFSGRGSAKWKCLYELEKKNTVSWKGDYRDNDELKNYEYFSIVKPKFDSLKTERERILEKWRPLLAGKVYDAIHTDVFASNELRMYSSFNFFMVYRPDSFTDLSMQFYEREMLSQKLLFKGSYNIRSHLLAELHNTAARLKVKYENYRNGTDKDLLTTSIDNLAKTYTEPFRSKLITESILRYGKASASISSATQHAIKYIQKGRYKKILENVIASKTPGSPAYNFELADVTGKKVRLSDFKNKIVIATIWMTNCSYCAGLEKAMKEIKTKYANDTTIVFLNIGADEDKEKWQLSVVKGIFTDTTRMNVYANPGSDPFLKFYTVEGFPTQIIFDQRMRLFAYNPPRPVTTADKQLFEELLHKAKQSSK
jgi:cytochrome oxidase Cu insertion factor (SCO1/SenC/PrrC family)